ncbi:hypothetical protein [Boudabousia marimammalium]|uniref:Ribosomal protein L7/L12 C-terminal domain-containing protein n=1 Tax=Boudabousia marimammalium TaxID=156892 RepID=A0A1Q5PT70_9ACTO|nr:hypothetical protein [Boudabousia marimammalium]OKL50652.1 hypothetical protein BM477_01515 [Boudabousia marimammalium]
MFFQRKSAATENQTLELASLRRQAVNQAATIAQLKLRLQAGQDNPATTDLGLTDAEISFILEGKRIGAMKSYQERTGTDLALAKAVIDSAASALK